MLRKNSPFRLILLITLLMNARSWSQPALCPPNLDFEEGTFNNWVCRTGNVSLLGGVNTFNWTTTGQVTGRHTIIPRGSGVDAFGGFPQSCPNGSAFSVMLGNTTTGNQAESIVYTFTIPSTVSTFSVLYQYAVVFQNPSHLPEEQPRFRARIRDLSTNNTIPCVTFDFTASSLLPGFLVSPVNSTVLYKGWTPVSLNLTPFIGRRIELEFITSDCTRGGHFGYAYVDVNSVCNGVIDGATLCAGATSANLTAPFGFQNYEWYADNSFGTLLSNTQTLSVSPVPAVGTIYPVIVIPYPGFGCRDTLYANITISPQPVSNAGPDQEVCVNRQVRIGAPPDPQYTYDWTPASQVSNPSAANPLAWNRTTAPLEFIVKTTDLLTGCFSYDTTILTGKAVDTSLTVSGKSDYCEGDPLGGNLTLNGTVTDIQWYNDVTAIPGATGAVYQPASSGIYWAEMQQQGCTDSSRRVTFNVFSVPVSDAGRDQAVCVRQPVQIGAPSNPLYTYNWQPAGQLSDNTLSNPSAWVNSTGPTTFVVQTTHSVGGCQSRDTVVLTGRMSDTTITVSGKRDFCQGDPAGGSLQVSSSLSAVQWYNGTTALAGGTGFQFRPTGSGNYWAQVQQFGCTDSTRTIPFTVYAIPTASFDMPPDTGCITNHSFLFTNTSSVGDGSPMTYLWKFSDGGTQPGTDATKVFSASGTYTVQLVTTTAFGCKDSTGLSRVYVMPNAKADFTWDSICVSRPVLFRNRSRENGSPRVGYAWRFNDGGAGSVLAYPPPVVYPAAGPVPVTLTLTSLGCESFPDSVTKTVQVNQPAPGIRYKDLTVPLGAKRFIHARDSIGNVFQWRPRVQLNTYYSRYAEFTAVNDVLYFIDIADPHTCVTTDTMQLLVLKKPGYYLPTAFTPNQDGLNDVVRPYLVGMQSLKGFSIYNRWGKLLFYSRKEGEGWDGKFLNVEQAAGVYVWVLEFYDLNNNLVTEKGTITLIR